MPVKLTRSEYMSCSSSLAIVGRSGACAAFAGKVWVGSPGTNTGVLEAKLVPVEVRPGVKEDEDGLVSVDMGELQVTVALSGVSSLDVEHVQTHVWPGRAVGWVSRGKLMSGLSGRGADAERSCMLRFCGALSKCSRNEGCTDGRASNGSAEAILRICVPVRSCCCAIIRSSPPSGMHASGPRSCHAGKRSELVLGSDVELGCP